MLQNGNLNLYLYLYIFMHSLSVNIYLYIVYIHAYFINEFNNFFNYDTEHTKYVLTKYLTSTSSNSFKVWLTMLKLKELMVRISEGSQLPLSWFRNLNLRPVVHAPSVCHWKHGILIKLVPSQICLLHCISGFGCAKNISLHGW